jgi:hypothetical protein
LVIIQDKKYSPREKAQILKRHYLNTIIEYCGSISYNIDFLSNTLGQLLLERLHIPSQTLLLENRDMLQFAGILNTLLTSLKTSISTIESSSKVVVGCYC